VSFQHQFGKLPGGANLGVAFAFDNDFAELNGRFVFRPGEGLSASKSDDA